jgi:plastocyanin
MTLADLHQLAPVLAAAGEKSKAPFYVAGALLAVWAVLVSVVGITRPDFPGSPLRTRAVMAISAVLVLVAVSSAVLTASKPAKEAKANESKAAATGGPLSLAADASGQLKFDRTSLTAKAGSVKLDFDNPSPVAHNVTLTLAGKKVAATQTVTQSKASLAATLKAGSYTFFCSVDGHEQAGMKGTLTVQ